MTDARDTAAAPEPLTARPIVPGIAPLPMVQMRGIVKRYGRTTALSGVDLDVRAGEIHALLGENGAGKSTLMQVLAGLTSPDAGQILLRGHSTRIDSPRMAREFGIAMVHQHFTLVPAFTVEENLALDAPGGHAGWNYRVTAAAAPALERASSLGWLLVPRARISDLPVGSQQRIEIIKALTTGAEILIFDEPTAVLTPDEVEDLFAVLRRLRAEGKAVILIAHKLAEILAVADRVTILRRGSWVACTPVALTNATQLAEWMVGSPLAASPMAEIADDAKASPRPDTQLNVGKIPLFTAEDLIVRSDRGDLAVDGITLEVAAGEIFGIGGVDGNGQTELAETLAGLRTALSGRLAWRGRGFLPGQNPCIGYIPQDRRRSGLALTLSIEDNLLFDAVRSAEFRYGPFIRRRALHRLVRELITRFDIRTDRPELPASSLSGGNQQKIVVARALYQNPEWIVAVSPTRGLDIVSSQFVHNQLRQARARGAAILLISTDLDELRLLADRGAIISEGRISAYQFGNGDASHLGLLMGGIDPLAEQVGSK